MDILNELIDGLEKCLYAQYKSGMENIDTDEFGKVVDILKDLVYIKSLMKTPTI